MREKMLNYWQLRKRKRPLDSLRDLGTIAEHHRTAIAHATLDAIAEAVINGSQYGWKA